MNMSTQLLYNDFPTFLRKYFPYKVQKISLNAGFTCPNRDGTKGWGGCTYCNNQTFNPDYCRTEKSIAIQLEEGKCFFAHKYPEMKYLAYFQAYTNTYAELVFQLLCCGMVSFCIVPPNSVYDGGRDRMNAHNNDFKERHDSGLF